MSKNSYFSFLGNIKINDVLLKNIFRKITSLDKFLDDKNLYFDHYIIDGQSPESLARYFYDDPELFWLIMIPNKRKDYFYDWPLDDRSLRKYSIKVYNEQEPIEPTGGFITGDTGDVVYPKTEEEIYSELSAENELKRTIKIFNPARMSDLLFELNKYRR